MDFVNYSSYISVKYPFIDDRVFDGIFGAQINRVVKQLIKEFAEDNIERTGLKKLDRFSKRAIGVPKITLDTKEILSGYVGIFNNQKAEVITLSFVYDKVKKELVDLDNLFKRNFNYSFFIKQYINQKKKDMQTLVSKTEAAWIKEEQFNYYVLTKSGLTFFGDYNTIFGRRRFMIPYSEIISSIGNKSLLNYLKHRESKVQLQTGK